MKDILKVGYIVADEDEYAPLRNMTEKLSAKRADFYSREGHIFSFEKNGKTVQVQTILCGIGMVNATAAATYLAGQGTDIILCSGLSGGISGIKRGELTVGTKYIEHDFDLTPLGYELCEKPLQNYVYKGDERIINLFTDMYPFIKKGVVVSGDSFICDDGKRNFLKDRFNAMSCDMESAAAAYVSEIAKIPFVTLRKISDDAGSDANESYTAALNIDGKQVLEILLNVIKKI